MATADERSINCSVWEGKAIGSKAREQKRRGKGGKKQETKENKGDRKEEEGVILKKKVGKI